MSEPVFTIGHSTRPLDDFLALLAASEIDVVVDVRKLPGSRRYPHFDADALSGSLREAGIAYERIPSLTGRRPVSRDVPFETNAWWQNRSFHNYADHALSSEFREGLAGLRAASAERRIALMCSEAVWWRCHRRIIADQLLAHGAEVRHILGEDHTDAATLSAGAVVGPGRLVTYPADP
ncbi:hypothetical protein GCM10010910_23620 [Microbacterium nanhaiense]|uniref:DUF488 domain-containing protein n=1 Tax=Microbacterium nanhaiense TaxID=1301026 RepID=A0ABQ2N259_9MICO|nr:DUF488 domain-containing protein [Microbacterium nanhaiense]GGO65747.1 hypothetical protein GCM10010910_23620 [Microbacterium nanhaiense]